MKQHPRFKRYTISEEGLVWDTQSKRFMTQTLSENGYLLVTLEVEPKTYKQKRVHRLVAETYIPNKDSDYLDINHIDGVKTNNNLNNLEWCNRSYNVLHAHDHGLNMCHCETHHNAKYSNEQIENVCSLLEGGSRNSDVVKLTGVDKDTISNIKRGKLWQRIACNYNLTVKRKKRLSKDKIFKLYILSQTEPDDNLLAKMFKVSTATVKRVRDKSVYKTLIEGYLNDYRNPA